MAEKFHFKGVCKSWSSDISRRIRKIALHIRRLEGDPDYIAKGMAIGILVGFTPTIPFHTILSVSMAVVLRGSKAAAALGAWISNPLTLPFFYWISYKTGIILLNNSAPFDLKYESMTDMLHSGLDVAGAMVLGGMIAGILPAVATYFFTRKLYETWQIQRRRRREDSTERPKRPIGTGIK